MKKKLSAVLAMILALSLAACSGSASSGSASSGSAEGAEASSGAANTAEAEAAAKETEETESGTTEGARTFKIGVCNYVDDASLNQIYDNLEKQLGVLSGEEGVEYEILYDNCNADANVLAQIIANFQSQNVDLMVGIATPVAMAMQSAVEGTDTPVVFSAVSDPLATGLVESLEAPGQNITGTSDFLNTDAVMDLIFAANPDAAKIGLLYDVGQDSSNTPIASAKAYLDAKNVTYIERTGTTVDEVMLAADALIADDVDAIFTPTDNTIMTAELSIYEKLAEAGIPHYCGADSFALNGAFVGYGVDYANIGVETANMVNDILVNGSDPAATPVRTFDNGIATVNLETCAALGYDYDEIEAAFAPYCTGIVNLNTAESFDDAQ